MTDEIQWSELRLHDGGECPVGPDDVVRVVYREWAEDSRRRDLGVELYPASMREL